MKKILIKINWLIILFILAATCLSSVVCFAADVTAADYILTDNTLDYNLARVREKLVEWKKSSLGLKPDENLLAADMLAMAGSTAGDWYPFGLARAGMSDNFEGYLASANDYITKKYATTDKLSKAKATEWHRIALAVSACGGDPRLAGNDSNIDLIADGTYNRVDSNGKGILGKQGINGYIWALIALDSKMYAVPEGAYYDRGNIIVALLERQLSDGGWSLIGNNADPDITAMTITALAPYYNSEVKYTYRNRNIDSNGKITFTVRQCVDRALNALALLQQPDGDFISWGTQNCESTVWVAVALSSLGRDVTKQTEFIKNGNTLIDGILKYKNADGGFIHSFTYDADNPSSKPDKSNTMTGEQVLYGITALLRLQNGERRLFDLRKEQSDELKAQIAEVIAQIDLLDENSDLQRVANVYEQYCKIDISERSYVANYSKLSLLIEKFGIEYEKEDMRYSESQSDAPQTMYEFSEADKQAVSALPKAITMKQKAEVLRLWAKINNCFDFEGKQTYVAKLELYKSSIDLLEAEIASISADIKEKLYPFDNITLKDKGEVYKLYKRYSALSDYDKTLIESADAEGLIRAKTQVDNLTVAVWVAVVAVALIAVLAIFVVLHVMARRKKRAAEKMPESEE